MTPGQLGYEAYAAHTGGKTFDGRDMPNWADVSERTKSAWEAAAEAIGQDAAIANMTETAGS